jgi:hypothetical protein
MASQSVRSVNDRGSKATDRRMGYLRAFEGTLSRWSQLHLQSLTPTNPLGPEYIGYSSSSFGKTWASRRNI